MATPIPELAPLPPAVYVGALLMHVADSLTDTVPAPLALTTDGSKVVLLEGQRVVATATVEVADDAPVTGELLRDIALRILDATQDLVMSSTSRVWPSGVAAHPAAAWTERGTLRLGYHPAGDAAREAALAVPDYCPPTGPPRVAG